MLPRGPSVATEGCFDSRPPAADHHVTGDDAVNYSIFARFVIFDVFRVFGRKVGQHGRQDGPRWGQNGASSGLLKRGPLLVVARNALRTLAERTFSGRFLTSFLRSQKWCRKWTLFASGCARQATGESVFSLIFWCVFLVSFF